MSQHERLRAALDKQAAVVETSYQRQVQQVEHALAEQQAELKAVQAAAPRKRINWAAIAEGDHNIKLAPEQETMLTDAGWKIGSNATQPVP